MKDDSPRKFGNYTKAKVDGNKAVKFVFSGLEGRPTLFVRPASEVNQDFHNDNMKKSKRIVRRMSRNGTIDPEMVKDNREKSYKLYAKHVVTRWENVVEEDGAGGTKPVKFSKKDCEEFLRSIPIDMFDDLREFCVTMDNFRDDDDLDDESKESLGKNS